MGGGILLIKNHTLFQLLSRVYPDFQFNKDLFSSSSSSIWEDEYLANYFVEWLKKQPETELPFLHKMISNMANKGSYPLTQTLKAAFPNYKWAVFAQSGLSKKSQYILKECLDVLFNRGNSVLLEEYKHPDITNLELDYFYPELKIAFEYQVSIKQ